MQTFPKIILVLSINLQRESLSHAGEHLIANKIRVIKKNRRKLLKPVIK